MKIKSAEGRQKAVNKKRYASASAEGGKIIGVIPFDSISEPLDDWNGRSEILDKKCFEVSDKLYVNRNHNNDIVLGRLGSNVKVESRADGVYFEIADPGTEAFKRSYEDIQAGVTPFISFEFGDEEAEERDGLVHIKSAELRAISLNVPNPAYEGASVYARALKLAKKKLFCDCPENKELIIDGRVNLTAVKSIEPHDRKERTTILNYFRGVNLNTDQKSKETKMNKDEIRALVSEILSARADEEQKKDEERKRAATEEELAAFRQFIVDRAGEDYETADAKTLLAKANELFGELDETRADKEEEEIVEKEEEKDRCAAVSAYRRNCIRALGKKMWNKKCVQELKRSFEKDETINNLRMNAAAAAPKSSVRSLEDWK